MPQHLYAIHDWADAWGAIIRDAGKSAWTVISEGIGDDPADRSGHDYSALAAYNVTPIVRLNYSHHGDGTLPLPNRYDMFAQRCANFVSASPGCQHWIIANEPNLAAERAGGVPITPRQYADAFAKCRNAIKQRGTQHKVIVAAVAPYNVDTGPWIDYWRDMLEAVELAGGADGLALHFYSRGATPQSITSDAKMNAPFDKLHNGFRAYRDFLAVVPASMRQLPAYGTETDQLDPWANVNSGWVQNAYAEIAQWNAEPSHQAIHCLCLYRWETFDQWGLKGKDNVVADFRAAVGLGFASPANLPVETNLPNIVNQPAVAQVTLPKRDWDERLTQRGVTIETPIVAPGQSFWRVVAARWYDESESQGRHHIYVEAMDGMPFRVEWPSGNSVGFTNGRAGFDAGNFPMSKSLNEFNVRMDEGRSETVRGIGMGANGNSGIHTSTGVVYQLVTMPAAITPKPPPVVTPPAPVPQLAHPVQDPSKRIISQRFGENPDAYEPFGMAGHTGIDFAVPVGTPIVAADDGMAIEMLDDSDGYGQYVKLKHAWGESLYAHLDRYQALIVGAVVKRGQVIALSGNSGNSTGPHLHFAIRINPYTRGHPWDGYSDPLPYLSGGATPGAQPSQPSTNIVQLIKAAAQEFGLEWQLVAALAWSESSFNPRAESKAGAKGLMQLMPPTWQEWSAKVGGTDIVNPSHNLRVGTAYLAWLIRYYKGDTYKAVIAYNFGPGNVDQGVKPPQGTIVYAERVLMGRDLLKAVGA